MLLLKNTTGISFLLLISALLLNRIASGQEVLLKWERQEQSKDACPIGSRCFDCGACQKLIWTAAHQFGTVTASSVRRHFSNHGHFSAHSVKNKLSRRKCPGHSRVCCPAFYKIVIWNVAPPEGIVNSTIKPAITHLALIEPKIKPEEKPRKKLRLLKRQYLQKQCTRPLQNRVFLGEEVKAGQLPWIVMLKYKENENLRFSCGGTLISDRYILTAAHCAKPRMETMNLVSARFGEVNIESDCDPVLDTDYQNDINSIFAGLIPNSSCAAAPQDIEVEEVVVHPEYKYSFIDGFPNDVALVRLKEKVKVDEFVHPICLRGLLENLTAAEEEQGVLTVAGWGMTDMEGGPRSNILKQSRVKRVPRNVCRDEHRVMVRDRCQKCAGGSTGNACTGDSGGPLLLQVKGKMSLLAGIVSFGTYECGAFATPSVFSDLSCYLDWIIDTIKL